MSGLYKTSLAEFESALATNRWPALSSSRSGKADPKREVVLHVDDRRQRCHLVQHPFLDVIWRARLIHVGIVGLAFLALGAVLLVVALSSPAMSNRVTWILISLVSLANGRFAFSLVGLLGAHLKTLGRFEECEVLAWIRGSAFTATSEADSTADF